MTMSPTLQKLMEAKAVHDQQEANKESPTLTALKEQQQVLDTGKGLPEPNYISFTPGSPFEQDIESVWSTGKSLNASPEEIANMIKAKYGDKYEIEDRDVTQQEKDDSWLPDVFIADKEYIVRDRTTNEALSLDNPGFSQSQVVGAATAIGKEVPMAVATRGKSLFGKVGYMGASGAGVNLADQTGIKAYGGKDEINLGEVGLAGVFTAGGELFGPIIWAGTKAIGAGIKGTKSVIDSIGRRLEIDQTRSQISDSLGTAAPRDPLTKIGAEKALKEYQDGWTIAQRNRIAEQALYGQGTVGSLDDIRLTPAEKLWDPKKSRFNQDGDASSKLHTEEYLRRNFPGYAEQLDKRLDNVSDLVDRPVAGGSTAAGRELVLYRGLKEDIEYAIRQRKKYLKEDLEKGSPEVIINRDKIAILENEAKLEVVNNKIKELEEAAKTETTTRALSKEDLGEGITRSVSESHDELKKFYKSRYEAAQRSGRESVIDNEMFNKVMPWGFIRKLPVEAKPIITEFESMLLPKKDIAGDIIKPTLNNIDEARKFLKGQIDKLYTKTNADFNPVLADKLNKISKQFDYNVDIYVKNNTKEFMDESGEDIAKLKEEWNFNNDVAEATVAHEKDRYDYLWSKHIKAGREAFAEFKEIFGEKTLLKKIVDEVDKGQKSVSQITNMLIATSGEPKFGDKVVDSLKDNTDVREAVKDYIYATTFFDNGNVLTGQKVTARFNKVKHSEAVKKLFGDDWDDFVKKAEKLQQIDVVRGSKAQGSPTQPKQEDYKAWESLLDKEEDRGFKKRALDYIGVTEEAQRDNTDKELLKRYVLDTVYTAEQMPQIVEGKPTYITRPTRAALAQEEAQFTSDLIDSATSNDEDDE